MTTPADDYIDTVPGELPLERRHDWPERLAAFLAIRGPLPFCWALNDCALFAADCVQELTGTDLAADLRGSYGSAEGAARVLARHGGLLELVRARLPVYVSPLQAHRGDVVCVSIIDPETSRGTYTLGIVAGNGSWASPGARHIEYRPMAEVVHAFAVG